MEFNAAPHRCPPRILLADDNSDHQRLIARQVENAGAVVTLADDGAVAVALTAQAERDGQPFDLILMDMDMPVLDGLQATSRIRASGFRGSIIAVTAHVMKGDREKCLAGGCDAFLPKPIDREELGRLLREHICEPSTP
jgi:CheY-like chemotaxis protein